MDEGNETVTNCNQLKLLAEDSKMRIATEDPELAFDRAMQTYLQKGYSKNWINQRL